jgi:hypothetical protein
MSGTVPVLFAVVAKKLPLQTIFRFKHLVFRHHKTLHHAPDAIEKNKKKKKTIIFSEFIG